MDKPDEIQEPGEIIALEVLHGNVEETTSENSTQCTKKTFKFIVAALHIIFVIFGCYQAYRLYTLKFTHNSYPFNQAQREFTEKRLLESINFSTNPCTNFYEFACGNWIEHNDIPNHMFRTSTSIELETALLRKIESYLNRPNSEHEPLAVHEARKMYRSCIGPNNLFRQYANNGTQNKISGFQKVSKILKKLHLPVVPDFSKKSKKFSWVLPAIRSKKLLNHNFFVQFSIRPDPFIINSNRIYITNPSSRFYSSFDGNDDHDTHSGSSFREFLKNVVTYMYEKTKLKWTTMTKLSFYRRFSKFFKFARRVEELDILSNNSYLAEYMSIDDLQQMTDKICKKNKNQKINWKVYLQEMFKGSTINFDLQNDDKLILIPNRDYLESILKLLAKTPPHILEFYMWWKTMFIVIPFSNNFLSGKYNDYFVEFFQKRRPPRDLYCSDLVNRAFRYATSYFIVQDNSMKKKISMISDMVENIRNTFAEELQTLPWLDEQTKTKAIKKLKSTKKNLGYPTWMNDPKKIDQYYDKVQMNEADLSQNVLKVKEKNFQRMLSQYHVENDHEKENPWIGHVLEVNGFYDSFYNNIVIPAGLLSYPFYDLGIEAMNYGAIGMIIGHEFTHGFDEEGKEFDNDGHLRTWWTNRTKVEYEKRAQCFVDYYKYFSFYHEKDKYSEMKTQLNSLLTLNENIADHGGLKIAFKAYKNYVKKHGYEKLFVNLNYTAEQLYFLAFARSRCERTSDQLLKFRFMDEHGSNIVRLLTTLSSSQEFADAWNCEVGVPMNPSEKKCQLW